MCCTMCVHPPSPLPLPPAPQIQIFDHRNQSLIQENRTLEAAYSEALESARREEAASATSQVQVCAMCVYRVCVCLQCCVVLMCISMSMSLSMFALIKCVSEAS